MKHLYLPHKLVLVSFCILATLLFSISCSKNETDIIVNDDISQNPSEEAENPIEPPVASTPPKNCEIDWDALQENEILIIDCNINLTQQIISIPKGVILKYEGGMLLDGTLQFEGNNKIDGDLLHHELHISGEVSLTENSFIFHPNRWNITEGMVSDQTARANRDILEETMHRMQALGALQFVIDKMDAYFNVDEPETLRPSIAAITIPSNFTLKMTSNTHLRMQPNAAIRPTLLATFQGENITIDGGVLHGDRDTHDYLTISSTHEWGHLLRITGTKNSTVKNMTFMDATGDGVDVHAVGHSFDPFYTFCDNVTITNNTFIRNRRNHISITDGRNIVVENNAFIDASIHTNASRGVAPGFAIDVEAVRHGNPRGISEIAEDITIRNNTETGSRVGAVTVHTGDRVTIEENTFERSISYSTSIGSIIRNNTLNATKDIDKTNGIAIVAGRSDLFDRNFDNKVYGNTINDFSIGIVASNKDLEVYSNIINNTKTGISIESIRNSQFYSNTIKSDRDGSDGIVSHPNVVYMDDVTIGGDATEMGNRIQVLRTPLKFVNINAESTTSDFKLIFNHNNINTVGTSTFSNSHGFDFINNQITEGGIRLVNASEAKFVGNIINTSTANGFRIDAGCQNISITDNSIRITDPRFECVKYNDPGINILETNTTCDKS